MGTVYVCLPMDILDAPCTEEVRPTPIPSTRVMPEPALIDPGLSVDTRAPDYAGTKMGYWPSYSSIPADCRAAYLHWLLDGRYAPGAYIGYVFLYFYGLERRLLVDSQSSLAARA